MQNQTQFEYRNGSSGSLIAGQQISLKPGFRAFNGSDYILYAYTPGSGWTALTNIISGDDTWFKIFSPLFDYIWQIPQFIRLVEVGKPLGGAQVTDEQGNVLADVTVAPGGTVNATVTIPVGSQKITITVKDVLGTATMLNSKGSMIDTVYDCSSARAQVTKREPKSRQNGSSLERGEDRDRHIPWPLDVPKNLFVQCGLRFEGKQPIV